MRIADGFDSLLTASDHISWVLVTYKATEQDGALSQSPRTGTRSSSL